MKPRSFLSFLFLLSSLILAGSLIVNVRQAQAQTGIELENVGALYQFGEQITFVATIKASIPIQSVSITISDESQAVRRVEQLNMQPDGRTEYRLNTKETVLRPFSSVKWNYQFVRNDGTTVQSGPFFMRYADNRFSWQTLEASSSKVNWYRGDASFGQSASEAVRTGLQSIDRLLPLDLAQPVEIFIYANAADLHDTLALGGEDWVAGHADPALSVVMVAIEPGTDQGIKMEQRIPHELMHIMLYRSIGSGYRNIPAWLREGTATLAEVYPNADYDRVLADASQKGGVIPLKQLCAAFPSDAGQAFLAYAESRSFTTYLYDTFGSTGLMNLARSYADGLDCERGPERAFGAPLSTLESRWRSSVLGQNVVLSSLQSMSSYLILLCLVLVIPLIGIAMTLRRKGSRNEPETYLRK